MKLPKNIKYTYALASSGYHVTLILYAIYPIVFMTTCLKMPAASAAAVISIGEVLDLILSLGLGGMIENCRLRWGKYRSWFYIAPLIAGVSCVLFFSPFLSRLPAGLMPPAAIFLYLVWNVSSTVVMICHSTLNNLLTKDPQERVGLNTLTNQLKAVFGMLFGSIILPVFFLVGGTKNVNLPGMTVLGIVFSLFYILCFFSFAAELKGLPSNDQGRCERIPLLETVKLLLHNGRLAALTLAATLTTSGEIIYNLLTSYFFIYVLGKIEILGAFNWASKLFLLIGSTTAIWYARRLSKKRIFVLASLLQAAMFLAAYFTVQRPFLTLLIICAGIMGQGIASCMIIPMYSDIADTVSKESGKRPGAVMAAGTLVYKFAGFIGALGTFLLARVGYVSGTEPSAGVVQGIRMISTINPFLFVAAGAAVLLLFYRSRFKLKSYGGPGAKRRARKML